MKVRRKGKPKPAASYRGKDNPKYGGESSCQLASELRARGFGDAEIADGLGISIGTLQSWKMQHNDFADALKRSEEEEALVAEKALLKLAQGYEYTEERILRNGFVARRKVVVPPNLSAIHQLLSFRKPQLFETDSKGDSGDAFLRILELMTEKGKRERAERNATKHESRNEI